MNVLSSPSTCCGEDALPSWRVLCRVLSVFPASNSIKFLYQHALRETVLRVCVSVCVYMFISISLSLYLSISVSPYFYISWLAEEAPVIDGIAPLQPSAALPLIACIAVTCVICIQTYTHTQTYIHTHVYTYLYPPPVCLYTIVYIWFLLQTLMRSSPWNIYYIYMQVYLVTHTHIHRHLHRHSHRHPHTPRHNYMLYEVLAVLCVSQ